MHIFDKLYFSVEISISSLVTATVHFKSRYVLKTAT